MAFRYGMRWRTKYFAVAFTFLPHSGFIRRKLGLASLGKVLHLPLLRVQLFRRSTAEITT